MSGVVFLDTETTGLDPTRHQVWEIGLIYNESEEVEWQLPVDLSRADPMGLSIGRFYERRQAVCYLAHPAKLSYVRWNGGKWGQTSTPDIGETLARLIDSKHIVGAIPSFDTAFLGPWMRSVGACPTWHYHIIDVEAMAVGFLAGVGHELPSLPWNSEDLSRFVGVDPDLFDRHTALGDARWAKAIYDRIQSATEVGA